MPHTQQLLKETRQDLSLTFARMVAVLSPSCHLFLTCLLSQWTQEFLFLSHGMRHTSQSPGGSDFENDFTLDMAFLDQAMGPRCLCQRQGG